MRPPGLPFLLPTFDFLLSIAILNSTVTTPPAEISSRTNGRVVLGALVLIGLWFVLCRQLSGEWSVNEQYSYGWFVPFFALFLFWLRWEGRPEGGGQKSEDGGQRAFAIALQNAERIVFSVGPEGDHLQVAVNVTCKDTEAASALLVQLENTTIRAPLDASIAARLVDAGNYVHAGTTVYRVEDNSTGNAPPSAYLACVAQKKDPVYASNQCDGLKAKNVKLLASGAALGAVGAVLMIAGAHTSAELGPGVIRVVHRIRF